ncbi:unnamed protein product, partial [Meganyctiphanes norvegica]
SVPRQCRRQEKQQPSCRWPPLLQHLLPLTTAALGEPRIEPLRSSSLTAMAPGYYFVKSNTANGSYKYSVPTGFAKYQRASSVGPPTTSYRNSSQFYVPPTTYNAYRRPPYSPSSSDPSRSSGGTYNGTSNTTYNNSSSTTSNGNGGGERFSRSTYSRASMPRELPARGYRAFSREPSPAPRYWRTERPSAVDVTVPSTASPYDYRMSSSTLENKSEITRASSVSRSRRDRFER